MESTGFNNNNTSEGNSTARPPLFSETNYSYWKNKMRIWIRSQDVRIWKVIENGNHIPTKTTSAKEEGVSVLKQVPKGEDEYSDDDWKKVAMNDKAINFIHCALNEHDYMKISTCETTKEIWDKLQITYEGTDHVKESKVFMLVHEWENFKMKDEESIEEALERLSKIFNNLSMLGTKYNDKQIVTKVLTSLTPKWNSKVNAIVEGRLYDQLTFDQLRGNLLTYKMTMLNSQKGEESKKKSLALKTTSLQEESDDNEEEGDEEFALLLKRFNKFAMKKNFKSKTKVPKCYECEEVGHIKPNCPKLQKEDKNKKFKKKEKAYISWENEDESDSDDNEVANLCLMASEEKVSNDNPTSFNLQDEYDALLEVYTKLTQDYSLLKKKNMELLKQNEMLKNKNINLGKDKCSTSSDPYKYCKMHENEITNLKNTLAKFNESSKNLDKMLKNQKHVHNKEGLGFEKGKFKNAKTPIRQPQAQKASMPKRNEAFKHPPQHASFRNYNHNAYRSKDVTFRKQPRQPFRNMHRMHNPNVICHYCNKVGHIAPIQIRIIESLFDNQSDHAATHITHQGLEILWQFRGLLVD
ncbi:uncharacterized protein LOC127746708 [Arachis duranensis]|uniref:Uncharacterized protein LOC127746708 n=1 Tax=Arachis duranensis TaxID=130453 RepID=A0A9C6TME9_ARADU|nr:uncharacterized protein LOC127746708 [Arachis duranensis]